MSGAWHELGSLQELFGGEASRGVAVEGVRVGLFLIDGEVHAIDDLCSHGNALLSEGELDGCEIECPLHAGVFDVRSGKALSAPLTRDVRRHEIRVEGGRLFVRIAQ